MNGFTLTGVNTRIEAPLKQIFTTNGDLTGSWDVDGFYFEWFGAKGDDSTSDSTAIEKSLNYGGTLVKGVKDKIYLLDAQITIPTAVDVEIDLQGATLKRDSAYTTSESVFNAASASSKSIIIRDGFISDGSGVTSDPFFNIDTRLNVTIQNLKCVSEGLIYEIFSTDDVKIIGNALENPIATPLSGSRLGDINNSTNVLVSDNIIKNAFGAIKVEAISASDGNVNVKVLNNSVIKAGDTAIFCRMIGSGSNFYRGCLIDGNYLEDIGKTPIKFTSPSGAVSGELSNCIITNNIIQGYASVVASPGIAVYRDDSDTLIDIDKIIISNNIIDGFDTSGVITALVTPTDARGIRLQNISNLTASNNIIKNVASDGLVINKCTHFTALGNSIENACVTTGTAGVLLTGSSLGTTDNYVTGTDGDGINLTQSREVIVRGSYNNNTGYGMQESSSGASGTKSGLNTYSIIARDNTTADIFMRGESNTDRSMEVNCFDSSGNRHLGDNTRRNALNTNDWASGRNNGFSFWNTTNSDIEVWNGSSWVKANGTAVDS